MNDPRHDPAPLPRTYERLSSPALWAPPLAGEVSADVAIVGGGYTGLSAALRLVENGARVALLEGHVIGWGGAGRAFGQVVPYAKHDAWHITAHFGPTDGERIVDALGSGPEFVFKLIDKYAIACSDTRTGLLFAAHSRASHATLARRVDQLSKRGAPIELLDEAATARAVGSDYYSYSVLDRRGGTLVPLAFVRGLGHAAQRAGVAVYEHSPVVDVARNGATWRVATDKGAVKAGAVVIGTGAYSNDLWPGLRQSIIPMRGHQIVSKPLSPNVLATILPGKQSVTDTRRLYSGLRVLPDGRLHVSADGPAFAHHGQVYRAKAERRVRDVFPQISSLEWEETWTGWVDMTTDQYPHLHELASGLWAAIGFSGRGIAWAMLMGREIAWRILDQPKDKLFMPVTPLRRIGIRPFAAPLVGALMQYYSVLDRMEAAGYVRPRKPADA